MTLKFFNTLSRKKEIFSPLKNKSVGIYTCGPTVYHYAHIGNLRSYIFADILKRTLKYNNYKVKHVINITDVGHLTSDSDEGEEKLEKGARREKKTVWQIADMYTEAFKKDLEQLNIIQPSIWAKATDNIEEQINLIKKLEKKGFTYQTSDGVYYDTSKFEDYTKFAKLKLTKDAKHRVKVNPEKKNSEDFALWKFCIGEHKNHTMRWDSPWGLGFPGWHIECTAMSIKYLGKHFDIHTGGIDHIPVHHTNEIAQAEPITGKPWVRFWMHNEFLVLKDEVKMAKSGENFLTLSKLVENGIHPLSYRYFTLTAHYRSKLNFSWEAIKNAHQSFQHLINSVFELKENLTSKENITTTKKFKDKFKKAVNDDLNMPVALSILYDVIKDKTIGNRQKLALIEDFDNVFGFGFEHMEREKVKLTKTQKDLVEKREQARKDKDWKKADELRDKLLKVGIVVEDTPKGPRWKKA